MTESEKGGDGPNEPSFRVVDRRRFSSDGSERETEDEQPTASAPSPDPAPRPSAADTSSTPGTPLGEPYGDRGPIPVEPTFGTLVLSLSTQALMCLGEIAEAAGIEPHQDLASARHLIDLLGVLEQKTKGNLTADEAALLERILYDLRMRFVEISRARVADPSRPTEE